jgi:adenylate cyclase
VHTGNAFVGSTGAGGTVSDFTALGDVVNTTARLASEAAAGELLVSAAAATASDLNSASAERRTLRVRGRSDPVQVVVLSSARQPD